MSELKVIGNGAYASFDTMVWPCPGTRMGDVNWTLRYGTPTKRDLLYAASIIEAYAQMIGDPEKKRRGVIKQLRTAQRRNPVTAKGE